MPDFPGSTGVLHTVDRGIHTKCLFPPPKTVNFTEFNPNRSWAVMYNQMWNLSMTNPIVQNQGNNRRSSNGGIVSNNGFAAHKKKIDYCWSFNKGVKCKFGKRCKFIERCSYCDEASHGVHNCHKLERNKEQRSRKSGSGGKPK